MHRPKTTLQALVSAKEAAEKELLEVRLMEKAEANAEGERGLQELVQKQAAALEKKHEEEIKSLRKELERVNASLEASEQGRERAQAEPEEMTMHVVTPSGSTSRGDRLCGRHWAGVLRL
uniref:Uncharacterized protein n=1 Tax=Chromera velia CCMP2878 TaxID=1169474 RepID=A0A0G4GYT0_9ALVE|eukprot:Cvel_23964.t1-p1 / transcript=Cvel_23964.t1 / gene=Cvel_23964 / organism=Chromera_velia_CCMP2878 / gene_product=hypothetical protein / transcript_product=hypothetical protein / location=Cvel_scaffold2534:25929-26285(-) / protein_length=119 / sequence_SO=supercontig / SO=protein_coding / is_pseudo=false